MSDDHCSTPGQFPGTRWSLVLEAQEDDPGALAALCRTYWFPLYCYARQLRPDVEDAKDLTQGFFEMLLSRQSLKLARADRGKLRSFLLGSLKNYAVQRYRAESALKRGGSRSMVEIDACAEERYAQETGHADTPEREFDRAWARQLLATVLEDLGQAYHQGGKGPLFDALKNHLTVERPGDYAEAAAALGLSLPTVRLAAFKLRARYRDLLRESILRTVTTPQEAEEELAHLRRLFGG